MFIQMKCLGFLCFFILMIEVFLFLLVIWNNYNIFNQPLGGGGEFWTLNQIHSLMIVFLFRR